MVTLYAVARKAKMISIPFRKNKKQKNQIANKDVYYNPIYVFQRMYVKGEGVGSDGWGVWG